MVWWSQLFAWLEARPDWTEIRAEAERSVWRSPDNDVLVLLPRGDEMPAPIEGLNARADGMVSDAHLHHIAALAGIDEVQLVAECCGEELVG